MHKQDNRKLGQLLNNPNGRETTARTPYYVIDVPHGIKGVLMGLHQDFIRTFRRQPADEDPQFWEAHPATGKPVPNSNLDVFISSLVAAMTRSNHHPAHIHAVKTTKRLIFGCGSCLDDCPLCNFRYVPEGWTAEWKAAVESDSNSWTSNLYTPSLSDIALANRSKH